MESMGYLQLLWTMIEDVELNLDSTKCMGERELNNVIE